MSLRETYERQAARYDAERGQTLFERAWLDRALADVPAGGAVLDLGCGAGRPIGVFLAGQGFAVTGVDFSSAMLALFSQNVPDARALLADMRTLDLGRTFDAIIGWGSFFHLTEAEQRAALPRIVAHLAPGGRLLLTVGPEAGEAWGTVGGGTRLPCLVVSGALRRDTRRGWRAGRGFRARGPGLQRAFAVACTAPGRGLGCRRTGRGETIQMQDMQHSSGTAGS
ncbi:class I SAM-dependent methyltransferase [Mameliella alba]|uniref:class I SAM-dependent methyltransferase n=1 Tax=Mameliella alba TaxID=561184 RepID=UPI00185EE7A6|nr:class I SAM-dependent methyltransferase [Mameliella alba]